MSGTLAIKGIREGLLITLGGSTWAEALDELLAHLDSKGDFFLGARIALQLGPLEPRAGDLAEVRSRLAKRGVTLWAVLTEAPAVASAAQSLGLATVLPTPAPDAPPGSGGGGTGALLIEATVPSGHRIESAGHVVIVGDVNLGAEIIAGGHIVVWGRLRGTAHAGALGNEGAVVCALDLSPMQLRIAGHTAVSPSRRGSPQPECAHLRDGKIATEVWEPSGPETRS
jgi:septum site-determining protein MinC